MTHPEPTITDLSDRTRFLAEDVDALLYGVDPTPGIVSVEFRAPNQMLLYQRQGDGTTHVLTRPFRPWLVTDQPGRWGNLRPPATITPLRGGHPRSHLVEFATWEHYRRATDGPTSRSEYYVNAPVSQYLMTSGVTLFKEMAFEDLRRMQIDLETLGLDPEVPDAAIIMIAMRQGDWEAVLIQETDEADLLRRFIALVQERDPDVIEGHNLYNFDLPYLIERARRQNVRLELGRDRSTPMTGAQPQRFRAGPTSMPYTFIHIHGRHIVDTYQQIQRFDTAGRLTSYGLKPAIRALGLEREDREFVAGADIAELWRAGERDRERLARYALDDVRDVDLLSRITIPTEFYQTQILPMTFQRATVTGTGRKIDDIMARAYLAAGHSLPIPAEPRGFPGGHVELLQTGVFSNVVKADVESLYPSIMVHDQIAAETDELRAFPLLLRELTQRRIQAKRRARETSGEEHALWDGLQASFKVLINSFYGYLGFGDGLFNDFDAAERVTLEGQRLIQTVVRTLQARGAEPIEVDTDGVYFTLPAGITGEEAEERFVQEIGATSLPDGIRLAHDGRSARMLSLKLKTYALLDYNGGLILKGSALRSRRMERCFLQFIEFAARGLMDDRRDEVRERYLGLAEAIQQRALPPEEISQWMMIRQRTLAKQPRLEQLLRQHEGRWSFGERVDVYERQDGTLGFTEDYAHDENVAVLLRRLWDTAVRFADAFPTTSAFEAFFPKITPRTRIEDARNQEEVSQLSLF